MLQYSWSSCERDQPHPHNARVSLTVLAVDSETICASSFNQTAIPGEQASMTGQTNSDGRAMIIELSFSSSSSRA